MILTRATTLLSLLLCMALSAAAQETPKPVTAPAAASPANAQESTPADAQKNAAQPAAPTKDAASPPPKKPRVMDRLELESTAITGNRELPKVLYIVPWKKSDLGDLTGRPANSLLDEVLAPVDREVFRRQTDYFDKLNSETAADRSK